MDEELYRMLVEAGLSEVEAIEAYEIMDEFTNMLFEMWLDSQNEQQK